MARVRKHAPQCFRGVGERRARIALHRVLAVLTLALLGTMMTPVLALAAEFTVDSTGDLADEVPGSQGCRTEADTCTLRAAIEESNISTDESNEIIFDGAVFNGQVSSTIVLGTNLPVVLASVRIDGGQCETAIGVTGPCVGIHGTNSGPALPVEAADVTVEGLDVFASSVGIAFTASHNFKLFGNWFGVRLDGKTLSQGDGTAVRAGPGSENGWVGGQEPEMGNLFVNGGQGLEIFGASHVHVLGNSFGIEPDGGSEWANGAFAEDIRIVSAPLKGFEAIGNTIGTTLSNAAAATPVCDGGCNLISGASYAIKLWAEGSAYGPPVETTVAGNNIGLDVAGTGHVPIGNGIATGSALRTLIGGPTSGDANRINGGGIRGGGPELLIEGNLIGVDASGTELLAPPTHGIVVYSNSLSDPALEATIAENEIGVADGNGISHEGLGATIAGNVIVGGRHGIYANGDSGELGNLIQDNLIEASEEAGVYLENSNNELYGNEVIESGGTGIYIAGHQPAGATENVVGGDTEASENEISFSGGPAIAISAREETENEVARNHGFENEGPFIRLWAVDAYSEPLGPNGGIEPPAFSTATNVSASGSGAEPGAVVRVFRNEFEDEGELGSFLGEALVDPYGNWTVEYPLLPPGTILAATQTLAGGTSELAMAATPGAAEDGSEADGGGTGAVTKEPERPSIAGSEDLDRPQTKIVKGPRHRTRSRRVRFRFRSDEAGSRFRCKLDRRPLTWCRSPKAYKKLKPGKHVFRVWAIDAAGNRDSSPAKRKFRVLRRKGKHHRRHKTHRHRSLVR